MKNLAISFLVDAKKKRHENLVEAHKERVTQLKRHTLEQQRDSNMDSLH